MKIISKKEINYDDDLYNLHIKNNHNYIVNGCVARNCHGFNAKSLTTLARKLTDTPYKFGFTGTLNESKSDEMSLNGMFGPTAQFVKTKELIDKKRVANLQVKIVRFRYGENDWELFSKVDKFDRNRYHNELEFIINHPKRNNFIKNISLDLKGNILLLYRFVESHGLNLYNTIKENTDRPVFFIHGKVLTEEREEIRKSIEKENNAIIVASVGTFSQGVNIVNLQYVIASAPSKSKIRVLQSIGRGLRIGERKHKVVWIDIADDLSYFYQDESDKRSILNEHFWARYKLYKSENFDRTLSNIDI